MNAKKILFATDFSPASETALELASSLASDTGATLYVAYSEVAIPYPIGGGVYGVPIEDVNTAKKCTEHAKTLREVQPTVEGVKCVHCFLEGPPADEIVALAEKESVDLIVVGSHGRKGLSHMLMGSVAEAIVRHAECPVVVVKHSAKLDQQDGQDG